MNPKPTDTRTELGLLGVLALLWGSSYLMIGIAVTEIPPVTLIAIRVSVAAVLLTGFAVWRGYAMPTGAPLWGRLALQSFFNSFGAWTLLAWGQRITDSGLAGVLNSTSPVFVVLISAAFLGGHVKLRAVLGAAIGLGGVVMIMGPGVLSGLGEAVAAEAAILAGAVLYALAAIHGARFSGLPPVVTAAATMMIASAVLVPAAFLLEAPLALSPGPGPVAAALSLGVFSTALALVLYFRLVGTLGPVAVASQAYLRAGLAVLLGMIFLGESLSGSTAFGIALALAGVILINWPTRKN